MTYIELIEHQTFLFGEDHNSTKNKEINIIYILTSYKKNLKFIE